MSDETQMVFERPPVSRIFSVAAALGSAALFFLYLSEHPYDWSMVALVALALLFFGTVAAAIVQYGDRIHLSDRGVKYENRLLTLLGRRGEWMRWEDIVEVREIKRRVLILLSTDGRRLLVDAILGYAIARAEIVRRAPQAILSGTLARDDS